jgi:hypothetical protein
MLESRDENKSLSSNDNDADRQLVGEAEHATSWVRSGAKVSGLLSRAPINESFSSSPDDDEDGSIKSRRIKMSYADNDIFGKMRREYD